MYSQSFFSINLLYNGDVALFLFEDKDFFNRIQLILEEINLLYEGGDGPDGDWGEYVGPLNKENIEYLQSINKLMINQL